MTVSFTAIGLYCDLSSRPLLSSIVSLRQEMLKNIPDFTARTPDQIVGDMVHYDSVGYTFRALSWLDFAERNQSVCALQYAAHDTRQAIEHILFEAVVLCVGTKLDREDYRKCLGNSTKLHKVVDRLNPEYQLLVRFTQVVMTTDPNAPSIVAWDHAKLLKFFGVVSTYLHWPGEPKESVDSAAWLEKGIARVREAARYIWDRKTTGFSGVAMPDGMTPEIRSLWERFRRGEIDLDGARRAADLAYPILKKRGEV